jgi:MFS family permease
MITSNLYVGEIFPTSYRGAAVAIAMSMGRLGAAVAPVLTGFLLLDMPEMDLGMWSQLQPLRIYMLFAILAGLGAWLFAELGLETGNSALPDHESDLQGQMTHKEFGGNLAHALGHSGEDSPLIPRRRQERTTSNLSSSNLSSGLVSEEEESQGGGEDAAGYHE